MPSNHKVLAFVMAGGEGSRLHPLTASRCKPAVPFNGKHRLVDFVLSNLVNSEIYSIYLLVQYRSQSLIEHIRQSWTMTRFIPHHFVTVVPPQMRNGPEWFQGTADAVFQNIHLIESFKPDIDVLLAALHRMRESNDNDFGFPPRATTSPLLSVQEPQEPAVDSIARMEVLT